ncbi:glycogen synthase [Anaerobutyricum hallii]|uniref:glycogen synthase n=1 Tax=Anaerobutyricum hallii TaxID=39488 RepID=UPI002671DD15|nr:glycogen/starch synthase [Anaerobutyricum hallii]
MAKKISTRKTTAKSSSTAKKTSVKNAEAEVKASVKEATVEPKTVAKKEAVKPKAAVKKTAKAKTPEKKETVEAKPEAKKEEAVKPKAAVKKTAKAKTPEKKETVEAKPEAKKEEAVKPKPAAKKKTVKAKTSEKKAAVKAKPVVKKEEAAEPKTEVKEKTVKAKPAAKKAEVEVKEPVKKVEIETKVPAKKVAVKAEAPSKKEVAEPQTAVKQDIPMEQPDLGPRRSVAFIGSECYPFVKTGGLGDVMSALPKALAKLNLDVKVILPRYKCIPQKYQEKMEYRGSFYMDLCADGKQYYVGIMEYQEDGVVYDFIDNDEFFSWGDPYTNLIDDIPKFCYFGKAALAALNYLDWTPDVVHCHDWQAALVPLYLRTCFSDTNVGRAIAVLTIHNLRFQGVYDRKTIQYWSGLPDYVFNKDCMIQNWLDANMLKGGITYSNKVTTVSNTYAWEIQTEEYGEGLEEHLRYHNNKVLGIVNGIDTDIWNPATDKLLASKYDAESAIKNKKANKKALQESLGLDVDDNKMVIGLISRLTNQKGLDIVNDVIPGIMDGNTQVVVLGTGDARYEDTFRYYEDKYKGSFCAYIAYNENVAHNIYAGCDALLVPSRFEPCGLTQLISMRYGAVPIVRETGGLKDTVQPYNAFENTGNGFTFDRYESGLLYDAINRAKTLYFENRVYWDDMVVRDMNKDVSWEQSAKQYKDMYVELTPRY